jgi:hypothetical protein
MSRRRCELFTRTDQAVATFSVRASSSCRRKWIPNNSDTNGEWASALAKAGTQMCPLRWEATYHQGDLHESRPVHHRSTAPRCPVSSDPPRPLHATGRFRKRRHRRSSINRGGNCRVPFGILGPTILEQPATRQLRWVRHAPDGTRLQDCTCAEPDACAVNAGGALPQMAPTTTPDPATPTNIDPKP